MVVLNFRNGFGFDAESVDSMPIWCWIEEQEEPLIGVFNGLIFKMPFFSLMWGKIYAVDDE